MEEGREDLQTMEVSMQEHIGLVEGASAALGGSDPENCSYSKHGCDGENYRSPSRDVKDIKANLDRPDTLSPNGNTLGTDEIKYDDKGDIVFQKKQVDPRSNPCARAVTASHVKLSQLYQKKKVLIWSVIGIIALLAYLAYFAYAMYYSKLEDEGSCRLLVCTCLGVVLLVLHWTSAFHQPLRIKLNTFMGDRKYHEIRRLIRWALYVLSLIATVTVIIVLVAIDNPKNLLSLIGLAAFIIVCFVTSHNPGMVDWHPVYWGFTLQFYFAALILKTRFGYLTFNWFGNRVTEFLAYSDEGAKFVFGDMTAIQQQEGEPLPIKAAYEIHFFAFKIMPVVTFFSAIVSISYYLGIMQKIVQVIGRFLSFCLGTTPAESLSAAGNIFVSMTETPLMIKPFLGKMTSSELHAVMTGGFATIAGSVLGAFIGFGVPADHLLTASVMSAPAALAISKLTYPEEEVPILKSTDYDKMEYSAEKNVIDAACSGAMMSAKIIGYILVNVIAFLSLLKFVNATLIWFGDRVGKDDFTFEYICSYLLFPVALLMGTEVDDCRRLAELIGIKTFTNEFIAYSNLANLIDNRQRWNDHMSVGNNTWKWQGDDIILIMGPTVNETLKKGIISQRSEVIATYALCGFSNFGSMGILLGGLTALAPNRRLTMSRLIIRAMIMGNVSCFFTACIAGLFYEDFG